VDTSHPRTLHGGCGCKSAYLSSMHFKLMPDVLLGNRCILREPTYSDLLNHAGRTTTDAVSAKSVPFNRVLGMFCNDFAAGIRLLVSGTIFCVEPSR
jgi:hypothetical protein